jgi:hypothetical protein
LLLWDLGTGWVVCLTEFTHWNNYTHITTEILLQAPSCVNCMECVALSSDVSPSGQWPWLLWIGTMSLWR